MTQMLLTVMDHVLQCGVHSSFTERLTVREEKPDQGREKGAPLVSSHREAACRGLPGFPISTWGSSCSRPTPRTERNRLKKGHSLPVL